MSQKRVFFLTGSRLAVYQGRRNPVETQVFQDSPAGLQAFAGYLDREPWAPVCLLLDLVEEEFRTESIPHVFGPDRRALVANRQRRLFQHTPYRYAVFQDQETSGRRDDNVLFAAVPRPDILRRWLHPITQRKIPLIGIYSLPILSRKLLRGIQAASPESVSDYALLVHCNADGGLRQSFFLRRHLKVSRLAVLPGSVAEAGGLDDAGCLSADILGEVGKTHHYLNGLRLLPVNHPLDVCFLSGAPTLASLAQQVTDTSNIRYHFIDIAKVGAAIGLSDKRTRDKHRTPHADPLFVRTLVRTVPANHYATPKDVRYFRFLQMRMAMYVIGVVLLSAGIGWGALQFSDALITRQKTVALKEESHIYEDRYARARRANLPDTPVDAPSLKAAVEMATIL
ncbi:MAG: hypothetical protein KJO08_01555, partial [Gammaproteobacteria bacterium]|nr:hypothetical protein [Gammaproteobacteria bacterium]NNJ85362.1 hypothetical protein [Gammaproteobacteria bacterium]